MMRPRERIPIIMANMHWKKFFEEVIKQPLPILDYTTIEGFWMENPDLRLTQVLCCLHLAQNLEGFWFYTEENDWLVEKGYLKFEECHFWGNTMDKNGVMHPLKWILLKDLTDDHINGILNYKGEMPIAKSYREYFEKRISNDKNKENKVS